MAKKLALYHSAMPAPMPDFLLTFFFVFQTLEKFHKERDAVADVVRQEFVDKIVATEEESRRTKQEMSELKARHRIELERCRTEIEKTKKQKENELDDVHER